MENCWENFVLKLIILSVEIIILSDLVLVDIYTFIVYLYLSCTADKLICSRQGMV